MYRYPLTVLAVKQRRESLWVGVAVSREQRPCRVSAVEKSAGPAGAHGCCTLIPLTVGSVVQVHLSSFACSAEASAIAQWNVPHSQ